MSYQQWLHRAEQLLQTSGIGTARLDSLLILEMVVKRDRTFILARLEQSLTARQIQKLDNLLNRRAQHEPIAYIRGFTEFYGHNFVITPAVLEPRPESETMLELLKSIVNDKISGLESVNNLRIADVGTGCGAIGICAKLLLPKSTVDLLDIDSKALEIAKRNVDIFTLNISVLKSDLLSNASPKLHILLCNLPYVPDDYVVNQAALNEPRLAIFGGADGLDIYRQLFQQVKNRRFKPLYIFTESLPPQFGRLTEIAILAGYEKAMNDDFITVFRHSK